MPLLVPNNGARTARPARHSLLVLVFLAALLLSASPLQQGVAAQDTTTILVPSSVTIDDTNGSSRPLVTDRLITAPDTSSSSSSPWDPSSSSIAENAQATDAATSIVSSDFLKAATTLDNGTAATSSLPTASQEDDGRSTSVHLDDPGDPSATASLNTDSLEVAPSSLVEGSSSPSTDLPEQVNLDTALDASNSLLLSTTPGDSSLRMTTSIRTAGPSAETPSPPNGLGTSSSNTTSKQSTDTPDGAGHPSLSLWSMASLSLTTLTVIGLSLL